MFGGSDLDYCLFSDSRKILLTLRESARLVVYIFIAKRACRQVGLALLDCELVDESFPKMITPVADHF